MAADRAKGALIKTQDVIKENVREVTGDHSTDATGKVDQAKGEIRRIAFAEIGGL